MAHGSTLDTHGPARLQAELAAAMERADRGETQLRTALDDSSRLSDRIELLQHELADAKRELAKAREETVAVTALAATHGARAVDLDREAVALRAKSYQLELDIVALSSERDRLQAELATMHITLNDMNAARNQMTNQLEDAARQLARSAASAAAADDRHKAEMQQVQLRLAASEAEFRALNHAKGTMHEDLQRARGEVLALQAQLQDESRQRDEQASECRRLQRELDTSTEALGQAQRSQRSAAAKCESLEEELARLRSIHSELEAEMHNTKERMEKLQDEVRRANERNAELEGQVNGLTANLRHLEVENARLTDSQAMLRVELEARAAEARAARGEAAELAADRARLLAEMQQRSAGTEEVSRLRDALNASRSEVTRLQKELAANDAVLAEAESALVALISEKESLQQALSVALMSERVAVDSVEDFKPQVAASLEAPDCPVPCEYCGEANKEAETDRPETTIEGNCINKQRMMSYLQSLPDLTAAVGPSESCHKASGRASPAFIPSGPGSMASSMATAAGMATVRVMDPTPPPPIGSRYPAQDALWTTESGSTLPTYQPGALNDPWEALSVSATDKSRKESSDGDGVTPSPPAGALSATSLVVASLSFSKGTPAGVRQEGAATPIKKGVTATMLVPSMTGFVIPTLNSVDAGATADAAAKVTTPASPRNATSVTPSSLHEEGVLRITIAGIAEEANAPCSPRSSSKASPRSPGSGASSALAGTSAGGLVNVSGSAPRNTLRSPRSPRSDVREQGDAFSSKPSVGAGDAGLHLQPSAGHNPMTITSASAESSHAKTSLARPPGSTSALPPDFTLTPPPDAYRTPSSASINLSPYQIAPPASAASASSSAPMSSGSRGGGGGGGGLTTPRGMAGTSGWPADMTTSPGLSRQAVSADTASMLQSSTYRSPTRVSLIAARAGIPSSVVAEGSDRTPATGPSHWSLGLGPAAASSPMISPRVMLEGRMLTRAVRPSADALSSPLRASGLVPGLVPVVEPVLGMAGPQHVQSGDGTTNRGPPGAASADKQTAHGQQTSMPSPPPRPPSPHSHPHPPLLQQTPSQTCRKPTGPLETTHPEANTFPSPFASGNAAAAIASPRTSGIVSALFSSSSPPSTIAAVAVPTASPRTSGTIGVGFVSPSPPPPVTSLERELISRRVSREQLQSSSSSADASQPSFSMTFSRRTTATQGVGPVVRVEAISAPAPMSDEGPQQPTPRRTAAKSPATVVRETSPTAAFGNPLLLPPAPSEEDATLLKRLAAMDEALRAIGAI